jgi:hypothetical protein
MPRHKVLLIRFRQIVIDIWGVSPELLLEGSAVQRYCEVLTALHEAVENSILNEISGNGNAGYAHSRLSL